ncbi:FadR/GntR family transcriptional regulator [Paenarthrobacter nitroguajacolicus]
MGIDWAPAAGIRGRSVSADIASHLEQLILTGQVRPGEKIPPEREIAEKLGVSRTSVRQAIHELTLKGLTDRKPGKGTVVTALDSKAGSLLNALSQEDRQLFQVTDLRQVVEPAVAHRAAERVTPAILQQLEDVLIRTLDVSTADESAELDEHFHLLVAHATQNPLLVALVELMKEWMTEVRHESHVTKVGREASLAGHQRIYRAIKANDAEQAESAMRDHISDIEQVVTKAKGSDARGGRASAKGDSATRALVTE